MPWIKVDDHFDEHPKFAQVGPLGIALWLAGMAYCNRNLTDGFIPWAAARTLLAWEFLRPHPEDGRELVYTIDVGTGMRGEQVTCQFVAEMLVDAGLWEEVQGGYSVHDFGHYQPSKAEVLEEREKTRLRVAKHRKDRGNAAGNAATDSVTNGAGNGGVTGAPVPVPVPREEERESPSPPTPRDAADEYYRLKGGQVSAGALSFIDELVRDFGDEAVAREMGAEAGRSALDREFLSRVRSALLLRGRREGREAEQRRKRRAVDELAEMERRAAEQTPEQRARIEELKAEAVRVIGKAMP